MPEETSGNIPENKLQIRAKLLSAIAKIQNTDTADSELSELKKITDKGPRAFDSFWRSSVKPEELVTSGAFRLKEYVPAQRIVYERNPDYYKIDEKGQKLPYIDKYIILF